MNEQSNMLYEEIEQRREENKDDTGIVRYGKAIWTKAASRGRKKEKVLTVNA